MRIKCSSVLLIALAVLVAGCGSNGNAAPQNTKVPKKGTPVPSPLVGYASLAYPSLKGSVQQLYVDLRVMKSASAKGNTFADAANQCSLDGNLVSGSFASYTQEASPPGVAGAYHFAYQGFRLALSALDECGIAGDSGKRKSMDTAVSDMNQAIGMLSHAEAIIAPWYHG
jgi:hypothetical protein